MLITPQSARSIDHSLKTLWAELLRFVEPPYADPDVRWSGAAVSNGLGYSIYPPFEFTEQQQAGIDLPTDGELYRFDVNHPDTNGMIDYSSDTNVLILTREKIEKFDQHPDDENHDHGDHN